MLAALCIPAVLATWVGALAWVMCRRFPVAKYTPPPPCTCGTGEPCQLPKGHPGHWQGDAATWDGRTPY